MALKAKPTAPNSAQVRPTVRCAVPPSAADAMGLDQAGTPGKHQQQKQRYRQSNAPGQCAHHFLGVSARPGELVEGAAQAPDDGQEHQNEDDPKTFHEEYP